MKTETKQNHDEKTLALIQRIKQERAEIAQAERPNWKTNCAFSFSYERKDSTPINLHVENNVSTLVKAAAFLLARESEFKEAEKKLGIGGGAFDWYGFTAPQWIDDIKTRINRIQLAEKKLKLEQLENRLNAIISPELRAAMELEEIEKALA